MASAGVPRQSHAPRDSSARPWQILMNCFVSLRSKRLVVLRSSCNLDAAFLAQNMTTLIAKSPEERCFLRAHPWWTSDTAAPGFWAVAHARFSALKLLDFLEMAATHEAAEQPFLVCMERLSPAELFCYFEHLPCGAFWWLDGSILSVRLPTNVCIMGTLHDSECTQVLLAPAVYRHAAVVSVSCMGDALPEWSEEMWCNRRHWQREFRSSVRQPELAMGKLARMLPINVTPLAPLAQVACWLGLHHVPDWLLGDAWVYLANAFDANGGCLFTEGTVENLTIAQDLFLAQTALPYLMGSSAIGTLRWAATKDLLGNFPRAQAFLADLLGSHPEPRAQIAGSAQSCKEERVMV